MTRPANMCRGDAEAAGRDNSGGPFLLKAPLEPSELAVYRTKMFANLMALRTRLPLDS
jgi:hypothetical protein